MLKITHISFKLFVRPVSREGLDNPWFWLDKGVRLMPLSFYLFLPWRLPRASLALPLWAIFVSDYRLINRKYRVSIADCNSSSRESYASQNLDRAVIKWASSFVVLLWLISPELGIHTLLSQKDGVCAMLDNTALAQHQYFVCINNCTQPMGDH